MEAPVFLPASQILARLLTVDSDVSGLNANTLQGYQASAFSLAGHTHSYQPLDAELTAIAGLTSAANTVPSFTGSGTAALLTVGTGANNLVQLTAASKLPAVDGSLLTNLPAPSGVLLATGATTGATSAVQPFTLGIDSAAAILASNAAGNHYRSIISYTAGGSTTGTIKILLPRSWSSTMMSITIKGFNYTAGQVYSSWQLTVSGYNFPSSWQAYGAEVTGNAPFTSVRLAHDGTYNCILLGTTATVWSSAKITVTDVLVGSSNFTGWGTGWTISLITSETGITDIVSAQTRLPGHFGWYPLPTSVPVHTDITDNSLYVFGDNLYARFGLVNLNGSGGGFPAYVQAGNVLGVYYNLLLNPNGGNLGIGGVTIPTALADVGASTTARASLRIRNGTWPTTPNDGDFGNDGNAINIMVNGTNAVNTDGGLGIYMQSSTDDRPVGRLLWQYTTKTDASRATRGSLTAFYTSTERKAITWGADASGPLLSFGTVTTPIAIQVLATGAGATADDIITALQAIGLVKQS